MSVLLLLYAIGDGYEVGGIVHTATAISYHTVWPTASRWTGSPHIAGLLYFFHAFLYTLLLLDASLPPVLSCSSEVSASLRGMVCGELILSRSGFDFLFFWLISF